MEIMDIVVLGLISECHSLDWEYLGRNCYYIVVTNGLCLDLWAIRVLWVSLWCKI